MRANGRASRSKGYRGEVEAVEVLAPYWPEAERNGNRYGRYDQGDIGGVPDWALQVKSVVRVDLGGFVDAAEAQAGHAGKRFGAVMIKLKGKHMRHGVMVMSVEQGVRLMRELETYRNNTESGNGDASRDPSTDR